jgi:hypothetical protein
VDDEAKDSCHYAWGNSTFMSSRFYHCHFNSFQPPRPFIWIWDSCCANKIKVFSWFLLMDRLNVRNILRRKRHKLQGNDYTCVLCSATTEETTFLLFFSCPFSLRCWKHLNINWRFGQQFHSMMEEARHNFNKFFMEIFILGCWQIWKQRNDFIFNRSSPSFLAWKLGFLEEANLQANRLSKDKRSQFLALNDLYR